MNEKYHMRHEYSSILPGTLNGFVARGITTFIETGTNIGQGVVAAMNAGFTSISSIEQDPTLFAETLDRFRSVPNVVLWRGDSPAMLYDLLIRQTKPCVVYLDAHSIEANPLLQEIDAIASSPCKNHVILIDDVRMFGTPDWHGLSKESALSQILLINPAYSIRYVDTAHGARDLMVCEVLNAD